MMTFSEYVKFKESVEVPASDDPTWKNMRAFMDPEPQGDDFGTKDLYALFDRIHDSVDPFKDCIQFLRAYASELQDRFGSDIASRWHQPFYAVDEKGMSQGYYLTNDKNITRKVNRADFAGLRMAFKGVVKLIERLRQSNQERDILNLKFLEDTLPYVKKVVNLFMTFVEKNKYASTARMMNSYKEKDRMRGYKLSGIDDAESRRIDMYNPARNI